MKKWYFKTGDFLKDVQFIWNLTLAMRVPSYDGFDFVVLSADTVIWRFEPGIWSPRFRGL